MNEKRLFTSRTVAYLAVVLIAYAVMIGLFKHYGPATEEAFTKWLEPESCLAERVSLVFLAVCLALAIFFLVKHWRKPGFVWRIFLVAYLFVWFGEDAQWGQAIFGFDTPGWWYYKSYKNAFDLHTVPNYGCLLSVAMIAATATMFVWQLVRAIRGDSMARLFSVIPLLVLFPSLIVPCKESLWQFFLSYFLAAFFLLEFARGRAA
ncbi:MAG: hypothetical protein ACTSXZ_06295 [Alphaproteobacteria bacterium]